MPDAYLLTIFLKMKGTKSLPSLCRSVHSSKLNNLGVCCSWIFLIVLGWTAVSLKGQSVIAFQNKVTSISAATFEREVPLAPNSIAAGFGVGLATQIAIATVDADPTIPGIQLPTSLAGTTVEVSGKRAGLFFVSPGQVNYLIPDGLPVGFNNVVVRSGDGTISTGTVLIAPVAPGFFTRNASGRGVPVGDVLRAKPNGERTSDPLFQFDQQLGSFVPKPINFGGDDELVFLVLYATGLRNRVNLDDVRVLIGGQELPCAYAGAQGGFAGLDQVNVQLPRSLLTLAGKGLVSLTLAVKGFAASPAVQIEIASSLPPPSLRVNGYNATTLQAGDTLLITGTGFSPNLTENRVFFSGTEEQTVGQVVAATATQLTVLVPFGSSTGPLKVATPLGQVEGPAPIKVLPSLSGFVQDNQRRPIKGMTVLANDGESTVTATTNDDGAFLLPNLNPALSVFVLFNKNIPLPLPYPDREFKIRPDPNGDRQLGYMEFQPITGASLAISDEGQPEALSVSEPIIVDIKQNINAAPEQALVTLDLAPGATITFPPGASGPLRLTLLDRGRTPARLPPAEFSTAIIQITPFGARINPGAKLTFPNVDGFPANAEARLFRFNQNPNDQALGSFVDVGPARVSADGQRIETSSTAVTETTYYFVSLPRQTTTVVGQVVENDQTPVRNTLVVSNGQETLTDGNGVFVIRNVPVNGTLAPSNLSGGGADLGVRVLAPIVLKDSINAATAIDTIGAEGNFLRPTRRVDRVRRDGFAPAIGGATRTSNLVLPQPPVNRPPVIQIENVLAMTAGTTLTLPFTVRDPDTGQSLQVSVTGANFASVTNLTGDTYALRLTPAANQAGSYTLAVTAIDSLGAVAISQLALTVRQP